ncbi:ABC transporter ATP-binding protein/permease [Alphaproteobacteria bacterium]|nr:ABC transporter ATP-binding protein/permease [Alphaproteobacteria bacterium]
MINFLRKTYEILNTNQRVLGLYIFFLIFVSLLIEVVGIGMIIPIIGLIVNFENFVNNEYFNFFYINFGKPSKEYAVLYSVLILLFIYIFKVLFFYHLTERQSEFVKNVNKLMSGKLLNYYLSQPFLYFTNKHSSELIRNTIGEVDLFSLALRDLITFILEIVIILGLLIFMFLFQPQTALALVLSLSILAIIFRYFSKNKLFGLGNLRLEYDRYRLQNLQNLISGIRDVKIYQKEIFFKNAFMENNNSLLDVRKSLNIINALPKYLIELVAILVLTIVVIFLIFSQTSSNDIIVILGVFAAIGLRILPSINRIYTNAQSLSFSFPLFENLYNEFNSGNIKIEDKIISPKNIKKIKFNKLSFRYPETDRMILADINLEISKGECIGIIGESGSGKSTFIDILSGLIEPEEKSVLVNDIDIRLFINDWKKNIGYVSQNLFLIDDTIEKNIAFGNQIIDPKLLEMSITSSMLNQYINDLPLKEKTHVGELGKKISGGQRQRIGIARALYKNPEILVFDEATNALDVETEKNVMDTIFNLKGNKTIIIVSHKINILERCDKIYKFSNKKLINYK